MILALERMSYMLQGVRHLGGNRGKADEGIFPLCLNKEHAKCILLICPETSKFGELLGKKWLTRMKM